MVVWCVRLDCVVCGVRVCGMSNCSFINASLKNEQFQDATIFLEKIFTMQQELKTSKVQDQFFTCIR